MAPKMRKVTDEGEFLMIEVAHPSLVEVQV
jgi:hypothetical protein